MKSNDYIKFMTEQFISYLDSPTEERKKRKTDQRKSTGIMNRWFGVLPLALKTFRKKAE